MFPGQREQSIGDGTQGLVPGDAFPAGVRRPLGRGSANRMGESVRMAHELRGGLALDAQRGARRMGGVGAKCHEDPVTDRRQRPAP